MDYMCGYGHLVPGFALFADAICKSHGEQFDENVFRSLDQASRNLERAETFNYLQSIMAEQDSYDLQSPYDLDSVRVVDPVIDSLLSATGHVSHKMRKLPNIGLSSGNIGHNSSWNQVTDRLQRQVQNAYVYERTLLNEVVLRVLYSASEKNLRDRLDPGMPGLCGTGQRAYVHADALPQRPYGKDGVCTGAFP